MTDSKELDEKLDDLINEVRELREMMERLVKKASRLDDHIDFVENTYDIARTPLNYILSNVSKVMGKCQKSLPEASY